MYSFSCVLRCKAVNWAGKPVLLDYISLDNNNVGSAQHLLIIPMLHMASIKCYEDILDRIEMLNSHSSLSHIFVEGVSISKIERTQEKMEWQLISKKAENSKIRQTIYNSAILHKDCASSKYMQGPPAINEQIQHFCKEYSLKYPLAKNMVIERFFFKPLLCLNWGHLMHNSDIILEDMHLDNLTSSELCSPVHSLLRERHFTETIITKLKYSNISSLSTTSVALWGLHHQTSCVNLLLQSGHFKHAVDGTIPKISSYINYGWNPLSY